MKHSHERVGFFCTEAIQPTLLLTVGETTVARVVFVDLLRLIATFQMLQGHTIDAVLDDRFRQGFIFSAWTFSRGLTSVAFLLVAGVAFEISTLRQFNSHKTNKKAVLRRFQRAFTLIGIGYLLHLPTAALFSADPTVLKTALGEFLIADILHCIGTSLIFLELSVVLIDRPHKVVTLCAIVFTAILFLTPLSTQLKSEGIWAIGLNYLTPSGGSIFPLFPWMAHILMGVCIGRLTHATSSTNQLAVRLISISVLLLFISWIAGQWMYWFLMSEHLSRAGWVIFAMACLVWLSKKITRLPRLIESIAGETLLIYVFHILLVYGYGLGLASIIGRSLPPVYAIAMVVPIVLFSVFFVFTYRRLEHLILLAHTLPTR